ncbi:PIG-L deacetylase family protein [Paenibacillus radicis (ex Xue et al. 2023)]|uniref:PIG-L family deacetylase n=1 Tax=Paenibacillus radicis (ex Xue et al. 2023) TaxID=2972489 RepID=A0ABT1YHG7_9BACL|nr:PIG-L family deacetylase [Paenibacillus radicis (ex Xue et al. 2023)]MCR8632412.1 PIG-L family deacetylase [Paenibacillus radicis (ex Xue et al. 2023)]
MVHKMVYIFITLLLVNCVSNVDVKPHTPVVLIIAAHPDDETIGMGLSIIQKKKLGQEVNVVVAVDGGKEEGTPNRETRVNRRMEESKSALRLAGLKDQEMIYLKYPDTNVSHSIEELYNDLLKIMKEKNPDEVYIQAWEAGNIDHDAVHFAAAQAAKSLKILERTYEFTEYNALHQPKLRNPQGIGFAALTDLPGIKVNASEEDINLKNKMLAQYSSEGALSIFRDWPELYRQLPAHDYLKKPYEKQAYPRFDNELKPEIEKFFEKKNLN